MIDEPPSPPLTVPAPSEPAPSEPAPVEIVSDQSELEPQLPTQEREDGSLIIDLTQLSNPATDCAMREPDPLNPEIVVCREVSLSPRIGPNPLPEVDDFGNAIPRARVQLSEDAEAEANAINKGVGGFNANGGEVRVKIDF